MGQTYQSITIDQPADRVWEAISNFHDLAWAPNVVTGVEVVGEIPGNQVGAVRVLNGVFRETLQEVDSESRTTSRPTSSVTVSTWRSSTT